ncbi:MAG TPA: hypothetical protein VK279_09530, partial [Solirubrobacteraceae bacterium]|nr:hypothetical protein [Solirubrobacteraceae bacterium]
MRVLGRWSGARPASTGHAVLAVGSARLDALAGVEPVPGHDEAFRAVFALPAALAPMLSDAVLLLGGRRVVLPAPVPAGEAGPEGDAAPAAARGASGAVVAAAGEPEGAA